MVRARRLYGCRMIQCNAEIPVEMAWCACIVEEENMVRILVVAAAALVKAGGGGGGGGAAAAAAIAATAIVQQSGVRVSYCYFCSSTVMKKK